MKNALDTVLKDEKVQKNYLFYPTLKKRATSGPRMGCGPLTCPRGIAIVSASALTADLRALGVPRVANAHDSRVRTNHLHRGHTFALVESSDSSVECCVRMIKLFGLFMTYLPLWQGCDT